MNKKLIGLTGLALLLSGCASTGDRFYNPICTLAGAVGGAAGAAAVATTGGGAFAGGVLATLLCSEDAGSPAPAPAPVASNEVLDFDGDGVPDFRDWCAGTPEGVSVDGEGCPLDSDIDGVADYMDQCPNTALNSYVDDTGCPAAGETLLTLVGVNFASGSAQLNTGASDILDEAVSVLRANPGVSVTVEGHTDSQGSSSLNLALSQRRAEAVVNYLISKGITADRLTARGRGEASPVAPNDTANGRWKNRRVELVVD